jgi:hypothetical protein
MNDIFNDGLFYDCNLLDFLFFNFLLHASFEITLFSFYWKLAIFYFSDNIHGFSFHFYLYSVREENTFYFEKIEKFICLFIANLFHDHNSKYT